MTQAKPSGKPGPIPITVMIGLSLGILATLLILTTRELTNTESVLLAILLSSASMLVSWLVTHLYSLSSLRDTIDQATASNTENIRALGVRAAEKVLNLSNELQRLIDAMTTALKDAEDEDSTEQPTMLLRERILSGIHNLETLKSMNDTFLSDWRGVIGEEIALQNALEQQIESLTDELNKRFEEWELLGTKLVSPDDLTAAQNRVEEIERRLTDKIRALPFNVRPKPAKARKEILVVQCPNCDQHKKIGMRLRKGAKVLKKCSTCGEYYSVRINNNGVTIVDSIPMFEYSGECPVCSDTIKERIADYPGAIVTLECGNCSADLQLSKSSDGVNLRIHRDKVQHLSQKLVDRVLELLPDQPWPKNIHKKIATELGISNSVASQIIRNHAEPLCIPAHQNESTPSETSANSERGKND